MNVNDPNDPLTPITEKQLARLWQRRAARSRALRTERGNRIRVLYPGRPGVTAGPDFRDALLLVENQGLVQGDVEVHLRQHDWRSHGHHEDPNYNGVALHVALETTGAHSSTASGGKPPLVALRALLDDPPAEDSPDEVRDHLWRLLEGQGYRRPDTAERMAALLNRAGDERFLSRSRVLQQPDVRATGRPNAVGIDLRGAGLPAQPAPVSAIGDSRSHRHAGKHGPADTRKRTERRIERRAPRIVRVR